VITLFAVAAGFSALYFLKPRELEQSLGERHTDFGPDCSENLLRRLLQSNADEEADNDVD
jgi:hypothetical protein